MGYGEYSVIVPSKSIATVAVLLDKLNLLELEAVSTFRKKVFVKRVDYGPGDYDSSSCVKLSYVGRYFSVVNNVSNVQRRMTSIS